MEEILRDLIKSYTEKGPPKQFYSNLSITEPIQKSVEASASISKGIKYLEKNIHASTGYQSQLYSSRDCSKRFQYKEIEILPEIYTSILTLQLLGDGEGYEAELKDSSLKKLVNFILPDCGITTFNLFQSHHNREKLEGFKCWEDDDNEDEDANDDQHSSSSDSCNSILPDDSNVTSLAVSVLLREGILETNPAASITELLLSNAPKSGGNEAQEFPGVIRTFLTGTSTASSGLDPVTCANVLYLYYQTNLTLKYEENVENTKLFLLQTLNNLLTCDDHEDATTTTTSDSETEEQKVLEQNTIHHSADAVVYSVARITTISSHIKHLFRDLLTAVLNKRLGASGYPLDLAMRILAADELGLIRRNGNSSIRKKLLKEYERLAMQQSDVDGSWPADSVFSLWINGNGGGGHGPLSRVFFGSKEVSTVFSCKALDVYYKAIKAQKIETRLFKDFAY